MNFFYDTEKIFVTAKQNNKRFNCWLTEHTLEFLSNKILKRTAEKNSGSNQEIACSSIKNERKNLFIAKKRFLMLIQIR